MADIITGTTTGFVSNVPEMTLAEVSDSRKEAVDNTNEIVREGLKTEAAVRSDVKDTRYDINTRIADQTAQITDRFFQIGRDTSDLMAQVAENRRAIDLSNSALSGKLETAILQNTIEGQKNTMYLGDKIAAENDRTRALINDLKYHDLNRALVERNSELIEERWGRRHWRDFAGQSQFAALQSQVQAFGSQLNDTRNSMVNFGTQLGVGQRSTSNNVG